MVSISFHPFPSIETERLFLRQLEREDAPDILVLRSDDRVNQFIDRKKMFSISEAEGFIEKISKAIENNESIMWAVVGKEENKFLGTACLWNIIKEEDKAEIGYELLFDAQGKGYMQEAVSTVLDYGFKSMNLKTINAVILDGNQRSVKLVEHYGFEFIKKDGEEMFYELSSQQ